jgi:hypothetical protein
MGLPVAKDGSDDVYVVTSAQGAVTGMIEAGTAFSATENGGAQIDDDDRKVLHLPTAKKKAHLQPNRKSASLGS